MNSEDYRERFIAEYKQLVIRYKGLRNMLDKWDSGELDFKPTCPRSTYNMQIIWIISIRSKRLLRPFWRP